MLKSFFLTHKQSPSVQPRKIDSQALKLITGGTEDHFSASWKGQLNSNDCLHWEGTVKLEANIPMKDFSIQPQAIIDGHGDIRAFGVQITVPIRLF